MLTVRIDDIDYNIKNHITEFTIGEFEYIINVISDDEIDRIDQFTQIFIHLGIPKDIVENLVIDTFFEIVSKFNFIYNGFDETINEKTKEVTIKNRIYRAYDETFSLSVKQMKFIEKYIKHSSKTCISDIMAIIFKDIELSDTEHYTDAHIRHKSNLFKDNITADIALPYLTYFNKELLSHLTKFII